MTWKEKKETKNQSPDYLRDRCDALYIFHKDNLYRMALTALNGDREMAMDVVEKTFINAFRHIDKLGDEQSEKTKAFMVSQLRGVLNVIYQKARERVGIPGDFNKIYITKQDQFDVDQVLIRNNEMLSKLAGYVDGLSSKEKEVLFYRYFLDLTPKEVASVFSLSEEDAQSCIFQVKQKIATMILEKRR